MRLESTCPLPYVAREVFYDDITEYLWIGGT